MYQSVIAVLVVLYVELMVLEQVNANYLLEIVFNTWENPFKAQANRCCDQLDTFPPNCAGSCETRFEICLQPFSYSSSNRNCPYGRYLVPFDSSIPDSDNIDFAVGVNLEGEVPNPMIYSIPTDLTKSIKLVVDVYDYDSTDDDDLINTLTFVFSSSTPVSSQFSGALQSSDHEVGILNISYRITCFGGYCGTDCEILCSDLSNNSMSNQDMTCTSPSETSTSSDETNGVLSDSEYTVFITIPIIVCLLCLLLVAVSAIFLLVMCFRSNKKKENSIKLPRIETGDIGINDERCSNTQSCNSDPCLYNNPAYGTKKSSVPENEEEGIYL